jgi:hypothetical protein
VQRKSPAKSGRDNRQLTIIGVALLAIGLILGYIASGVSNKDSANTTFSSPVNANISSLAVMEIAKAFDCFCGTCDHQLAECSCEHPRGAKEVKTFIAIKLAEGHKSPHIVELVRERFGKNPLLDLNLPKMPENG